jgi:hypothetical protein
MRERNSTRASLKRFASHLKRSTARTSATAAKSPRNLQVAVARVPKTMSPRGAIGGETVDALS